MKKILSLLIFLILITGCTAKNDSTKVYNLKKNIEDFEGQDIAIEGIYLENAVPSIEVISHKVKNGRNVIRLDFEKKYFLDKIGKNKIWFGDKVKIIGTIKAENMKVPEISVKDIKKIRK